MISVFFFFSICSNYDRGERGNEVKDMASKILVSALYGPLVEHEYDCTGYD